MNNLKPLFWKQKESGEIDSEKENNVTHAFLILLRDNPNFLKKMITHLNLSFNFDSNYDVYFQVNKKLKYKTNETKNKIILSIISKYGSSDKNVCEKEDSKNSIPDGLIIDSKNALLIEAKVSSKKSNEQIKRYNVQFFNGDAKEITIYWEDLYSLISKQILKKTKTIPEYVLKEFKNYLEVIKLSGFSGIPFFNKEKNYDKDLASDLLKKLVLDLKSQKWFKNNSFIIKERPKTSAWDYFYDEKIIEENPLVFPHYSIYIFETYFGIDIIFHKPQLTKILKNELLFSKFTQYLEKFAKYSPDYYLVAVNYRKIANKEKYTRARNGADYHDFEFSMQIKRLIENRADWKERLKMYLELISKENVKQFSILRELDYLDKNKIKLTEGNECFKLIEKTIEETKPFYDFMLDIYNEKI